MLLAAGPANFCPTPNNGLNEAEVYDPATGTWAVTGALSVSRHSNTITVLPNGNVLLAGGFTTGGITTSSDIYNPVTGTFSLTGSLSFARAIAVGSGDNGEAPLLHNGQVLFAAGSGSSGNVLGSAELFDPASGTWTNTGGLATPRSYNTTTLLQDGKVLVIGGLDSGNLALGSTELYSPQVTWTSSNQNAATIDQTGVATAVGNGATTITLTSGSVSGSTTLTVATDTEPPTTNANVTAPNANGWNQSNVAVTLAASDTGGAVSASGVQSITYAFTGAQTGGGTFNTDFTSLTVTKEGTTTLTYHATDNRGNVEAPHAVTIKIDKTLPFVSYPFQLQMPATSSAGAVANFSVTASDAISGLAGPVSVSPLVSGNTFPLGTTHETVTATDAAGNTAVAHFDVFVTQARPNIHMSGQIVSADGNAHPATATATDGFGAPVNGSFTFSYAPGGAAAPVAPGTYQATATFTSADPAFTSASTWATVAPDPDGKTSPGVAEINGRLYVQGFHQDFGGQSSFAPRLSIYDPSSNGWTTGAPPSFIRAYANAVSIGGKMYVVGGCLMADCSLATSALEIYDPIANSWSNGAAMPTARFGAAAGVIGGKLYVTGGSRSNYNATNVTEIYDPVANAWTTGTPIPVSRELAATAVVNGELYVMGGYQRAPVEAPVALVDVFNPATGWSTRTAMPTARYGAATGVIGPQLYVLGGTGVTGLLSTNEGFDLAGNTWATVSPMPTARTYVTGAVVNFRLFIIDGDAGNPTPLGLNEMFDPGLTAPIVINATFPFVSVSGSPNPSSYGTTVTFTATVAPPSNFGPASTPTGTVAFTIDGTPVAVQTLVNGQASFSTNSLIGTSCPPQPAQCFGHTVVAAYSGDTFYRSASQSTNQFVNRRQLESTLTSSPNPSTFGQTVTFTATVTDPGGFGTPIGTVTFTIDGNQVGSPGLANGQAIFVTSSLGAGNHNISVNFNGDLNYQPSSASTNQTINIPAPSLSVSPSTLTKNSGNNFTFSGTGVPGASVGLFDGLNQFANGGVIPVNGTWSTSVVVDTLLVGTHSMTAKQQTNGQFGPASAAVTVHVRPPVPGISSPGSVSSSIIPASVTLSGSGFYGAGQNPPTGATVTILESAAQIGTTVVASGGQWSTTVLLSLGSHSLRASQSLGGETSDLSNSFTVTVTQPVTLLSISVSPSTTSIGTGETQQFQASGVFSDGQTRQLSTGGSGGNGGSGNSTPSWNAHFTSSLNVSACAAGTSFSSQAITPNTSGVVNTTWGTPASVQVNGTVTAPTAAAPQINLTLTCIPANGASGSVTASWTGTRYEGTATLSGATVPVMFTGWSTKASLPTPRNVAGAATVNGMVYALGGFNPSLAQSVDAYNPATDSWSTVAQMQTSREGAGVAALNNKIYVAGGHLSGGAASGLLEVFDPATNTWNGVALASMPTPRAHFALVAAGGKLYALGGDTGVNNSGVTGVVEIYDPAQNQWFARMPMSAPRNFFAAGALNSGATIVVAGGAGSGPSTELYSVAGDSWTVGSPMPNAGISSGAVANNALWVFGGSASGNAVQMFRLAISPQLPAGWSTLGGMPTARGQFGAAAVGDVVYVIGGQTNGVPVTTVEAFSAPPPSDLLVGAGSGGGGGGSSLPSVQWQSLNTGVATVNASGFATGIGGGQTGIVAFACPTASTCDPTARISGSATLTVIPPTFVTFTLAPGSLTPPSNQVTITLSRPPAPDTFTETITIGQAESVDEPGTYHIVFTAPAGFTVTPAEGDITITAGDNLNVPLFFALIDTTPPVLTVSSNVTVEATSATGAPVTFAAATATDAGSGVQSVSCDRAPGDTFPQGTTTVSCSATDQNGNTAHASFTVTVQDTTPPTLTVPANISIVLATNTGTAIATFTASATDVVDNAPTVNCAPASGTAFPIGTTTVSCTASDHTGHSSQPKTFKVIVAPKNAKAPKVTAPANMIVEATGPSGAIVTFTATATDPVYGTTLPVTCLPASGSTFPLGATSVVCSAANDFGKSDSDTTKITVRDKTDPVIVSATPSVTVLPDTDQTVPVFFTVVATDVVDPAPFCRITKVAGGGSDLNNDGIIDWLITGNLTLNIEANARKHKDRTYKITIKCTDASGNTSVEKTAIVISHNP